MTNNTEPSQTNTSEDGQPPQVFPFIEELAETQQNAKSIDMEDWKKMSKSERYLEASKLLSWDDFKRIDRMPCFRDGFLYGLTGGAVLGALRFIQRGNVLSACNWAVFGTCGLAIVSREVCLYQRRQQLHRIHMALKTPVKTGTHYSAPQGRADDFVSSSSSSPSNPSDSTSSS
ncbi:hypothetical protein IWQ62_006050 [Dispira parvispora]|uniref:Cytochrome c oxidase assembly protein COX20, mitochondrial n=1 Tax=Dispira parvispora TaxID=1520584 RepID=A0A9W8AIT7_9FUNG|nr:hypothetical protein IWQ62_006050 [Dispira parvispora]